MEKSPLVAKQKSPPLARRIEPDREALSGHGGGVQLGKTIETLLRNDLLLVHEVGFAPLDDTARSCSSAWSRPLRATRPGPGLLASHWSFEDRGRFLPEHTTGVSMLDRLLHHATTVITSSRSQLMREARARQGGELLTK